MRQRRVKQGTLGCSPFWTHQDNTLFQPNQRDFFPRYATDFELFLTNDSANEVSSRTENDYGDDAYDKDNYEDDVNEESDVIDIERIKKVHEYKFDT